MKSLIERINLLEEKINQLKTENAKLNTENAKLKDEKARLKDHVAKLEERLNKNSKNSSKPPSTDQKGNTTKKTPEKRKSRAGKNRSFFPPEKVDERIECSLENCPYCNSNNIKELSHEVLQQVELPKVKAQITEYLLKNYKCNSCKETFESNLPAGVPFSAFGSNLMGLIAVLTGVYHLAKREAIQLIKDLYSIDIGLGSVTNIEERVTEALEIVYKRIHNFVLKSSITKHFDETGWRDKGTRHYAWIATSDKAAFYKIDRHRSKIAFESLVQDCILNDKKCVTDRYAVYNNISTSHQFCLAHLIREFRCFSQRAGPDQKIGKSIEERFSKACKAHRKFRNNEMSLANRNRQLGRLKNGIKFWLEDGYANGSEDLHKICGTLLDAFDNLWVFSKFSDVEPTNNLAERDLRKLVVWRKKCYGTRSERGKKFVERITTVSQTVRKQGENVLRFLESVIKKFYSNKDPDFINPAYNF